MEAAPTEQLHAVGWCGAQPTVTGAQDNNKHIDEADEHNIYSTVQVEQCKQAQYIHLHTKPREEKRREEKADRPTDGRGRKVASRSRRRPWISYYCMYSNSNIITGRPRQQQQA